MSRKTRLYQTPRTYMSIRDKNARLAEYQHMAQAMHEKALYMTTLVVQLVRSLDGANVLIIPKDDMKPAHKDDVLDVQLLANGDLRIEVSNPDLDAQIAEFKQEIVK